MSAEDSHTLIEETVHKNKKYSANTLIASAILSTPSTTIQSHTSSVISKCSRSMPLKSCKSTRGISYNNWRTQNTIPWFYIQMFLKSSLPYSWFDDEVESTLTLSSPESDESLGPDEMSSTVSSRGCFVVSGGGFKLSSACAKKCACP